MATAQLDTRGAVTSQARRELARHRGILREQHRRLLVDVRAAGIEASQHAQFTDLVNAVALRVAKEDLARLRAQDGVVSVVPERRLRSAADLSVPLVEASEAWEGEDGAGTPVRGAGTTVAVLDTGVDYTHPSLGGGFGAGHKVLEGHDFVNDDEDPMDDNGHGTHVAGIVAAKGEVTGVAPSHRWRPTRCSTSAVSVGRPTSSPPWSGPPPLTTRTVPT